MHSCCGFSNRVLILRFAGCINNANRVNSVLLSITTSAIGSRGNWTLSFSVRNRGFAGPPRPTVWPLPNTSMSPGVSTCKYRLFSQHLINVSGGLLMCKWVKAPLPLCRHNLCAEAQSCLRSRDSQISRCGAKPVALSTREPLRVFNSLSLSLPLAFPQLSVCSDETYACVCARRRLHYLSMSAQLYHSPISYPSASPASEWLGEGGLEEVRDIQIVVSCIKLLQSQGRTNKQIKG